jgi:hypothetical protein
MRSERKIWAALLDNLSGYTFFVAFEVLCELLGQFLGLSFVGVFIDPAVDGTKNLRVNTENSLWYLELESTHDVGL